jgi:hypothetical protein
MDALSAAASVIAVIQISESVLSACYQYIKTVKDAKKDIIDIIDVISGLKGILDNLRVVFDAQKDPLFLNSACLDVPLQMCEAALQEIATKLGVKTLGMNSGPDRVTVSFPKTLKWPWKEKEVRKILEKIEKHKTTFILAFTADTSQAALAIKDGVTEVSESIRTMNISQRDDKIIDWLKLGDPSTNHDSARIKHEPNSGKWLIESEPMFDSWIEGTNASLWIHAIPGAGKTILCSTIIEHVKMLCGEWSSRKHAYFYFDFNDPQKRSVEGMLRSIIVQLCVRTTPVEVHDLYRQCDHGKSKPGRENLIKTLLSVLANSHQTYLIMDALDECSEREELLDMINRIVHMSSGTNLLVTSRKERDIEEGLTDTIELRIGLDGPRIDADIRLYVDKSLENDKSLRKWTPSIKQEIKDALIRGAHGM